MKFKPVKITKRGSSYQLYYYNPRGERRRISVGIDYQHAQRLAVKFNDWLMDGKDPERELKLSQQSEQAKEITIKEFFPVFMERHGIQQSIKMQQLYHTCYKNCCRCTDLADIPIKSITKGLILDYMHQRIKQDKVSPATVNREASFVKGMLSRATEWEIFSQNPLYGLKMFKEPEKRKVDITLEQIEALLNDLSQHSADIVEFALFSGFRRENILSLCIEQIKFHDLTNTGEVELVVKFGRKETFPIGNQAVTVLKRVIGKRTAGFVFVNPRTGTRYNTIHKGFDKAVRKLGLNVNGSKLRFHDLRHLYSTWLHRHGVSLDVLRELLGHRDRKTTDRYATLDRIEAGKFLNAMPKIKRRVS